MRPVIFKIQCLEAAKTPIWMFLSRHLLSDLPQGFNNLWIDWGLQAYAGSESDVLFLYASAVEWK